MTEAHNDDPRAFPGSTVRQSEHPQITGPGILVTNDNGVMRHIKPHEVDAGTVKR